MDLLRRRIAKADARLASFSCGIRVHREWTAAHEQKLHPCCRQDTLLAMRRHEDAYVLYTSELQRCDTYQGLYRGGRAWQSYMLKLDTLEAALDDFFQIAVKKIA